MSYLKKISETRHKNIIEMSESATLTSPISLSCGSCSMFYMEYKQLLAHLYWRHGTEGSCCKTCGLKRWRFASHVCHVLPINDRDVEECTQSWNSVYHERESDYCSCGIYLEDAPMIGCDGPRCVLQWYHFKCVGIESPPDGEWFCPECLRNKPKAFAKEQSQRVKT